MQENVILIGDIPGPSEPKCLNSFLSPLVHQLHRFWNGIMLENVHGTKIAVRAALLGVACDVPAACKTCGFVSHNALHGCSKCLVEFPCAGFGEKSDYSNFDRTTWGIRDRKQHNEAACNETFKQGSAKRR